MTQTVHGKNYEIEALEPVVLSALDLALIADTLNSSTAITDNGRLFQYSVAARRETMQRVLDIMSGFLVQIAKR